MLKLSTKYSVNDVKPQEYILDCLFRGFESLGNEHPEFRVYEAIRKNNLTQLKNNLTLSELQPEKMIINELDDNIFFEYISNKLSSSKKEIKLSVYFNSIFYAAYFRRKEILSYLFEYFSKNSDMFKLGLYNSYAPALESIIQMEVCNEGDWGGKTSVSFKINILEFVLMLNNNDLFFHCLELVNIYANKSNMYISDIFHFLLHNNETILSSLEKFRNGNGNEVAKKIYTQYDLLLNKQKVRDHGTELLLFVGRCFFISHDNEEKIIKLKYLELFNKYVKQIKSKDYIMESEELFRLRKLYSGEPYSILSLLACYPEKGLIVLKSLINKNTGLLSKISSNALCATYKKKDAILENVSTLYWLCSNEKSLKLFAELLYQQPKIAKLITSEALCAKRNKKTLKHQNISVLYLLCSSEYALKIFKQLLNLNSEIATYITAESLGAKCRQYIKISEYCIYLYKYFYNVTALYNLCCSLEGIEIFDQLLHINPKIVNFITQDALCACRNKYSDAYAYTSAFYWLCYFDEGLDLINKILDMNSNFAKLITSEALCEKCDVRAIKYENTSSLSWLFYSEKGLIVFEKLLKENPKIANLITKDAFCALRNDYSGFDENISPLFQLCATDKGLDIFNQLLKINPYVAKILTKEAFSIRCSKYAPQYANTSVLYCLCCSQNGLKTLEKLLTLNPNIANLITKEALNTINCTNIKAYQNVSALYLLIASTKGFKIFKKLLNFNPNLSNLITKEGLSSVCGKEAGIFENTSALYWLCYKNRLEVFDQLLENNPKIAFLITQRALCALRNEAPINHENTSALRLLCDTQEGLEILDKLLNINPNIAFLITKECFCAKPTKQTVLLEGLSVSRILISNLFKTMLKNLEKNPCCVRADTPMLSQRKQRTNLYNILIKLFNINHNLANFLKFDNELIDFMLKNDKLFDSISSYFSQKLFDLSHLTLNEQEFKLIDDFIKMNSYITKVKFNKDYNQLINLSLLTYCGLDLNLILYIAKFLPLREDIGKNSHQVLDDIVVSSPNLLCCYPGSNLTMELNILENLTKINKYLTRNKNLLILVEKICRHKLFGFSKHLVNEDKENFHDLFGVKVCDIHTQIDLENIYTQMIKHKVSQQIKECFARNFATYFQANINKSIFGTEIRKVPFIELCKGAEKCYFVLNYALELEGKRARTFAKNILYDFLFDDETHYSGSSFKKKKKVRLILNYIEDKIFSQDALSRIILLEKLALLADKSEKSLAFRKVIQNDELWHYVYYDVLYSKKFPDINIYIQKHKSDLNDYICKKNKIRRKTVDIVRSNMVFNYSFMLFYNFHLNEQKPIKINILEEKKPNKVFEENNTRSDFGIVEFFINLFQSSSSPTSLESNYLTLV